MPSRLSSHRYAAGPDGDCRECGTACDPFGLKTEHAFPEPVQDMTDAPICRSCWHRSHPGPCPALTPVRRVACGCRGEAA